MNFYNLSTPTYPFKFMWGKGDRDHSTQMKTCPLLWTSSWPFSSFFRERGLVREPCSRKYYHQISWPLARGAYSRSSEYPKRPKKLKAGADWRQKAGDWRSENPLENFRGGDICRPEDLHTGNLSQGSESKVFLFLTPSPTNSLFSFTHYLAMTPSIQSNSTDPNGVHGKKVTPFRYTASAAFLDTLIAAGVKYLFVNLGTDHPGLVEVFAHASMTKRKDFPRVMTCPNEMVALTIAHSYAQITGECQAVLLHVETGTLAMAGALHNAAKARVPVLIWAGASPSTIEGEVLGGRTEFIQFQQEYTPSLKIAHSKCP